MADARRALGDLGEALAERALRGRGWEIVGRKARTRYGEIDLVCRDAHAFVFVEVKTRREGSFVPAAEAADARKVGRIARLAEAWLAARGRRSASWRIALVALTVGPTEVQARLIDPLE